MKLHQGEGEDFDRYVIVDCPDGLTIIPPHADVYVECHTTYPDSKQYLRDLPSSIRAVLSPSDQFSGEIRPLVPSRTPVRTLWNYVPEVKRATLPKLNSEPSFTFFHYGRMDFWKNDAEVVATFAEVARNEPRAKFILCGDNLGEDRYFRYLSDAGLIGRCRLMPSISFEDVDTFLRQMVEARAIFISSSRGESFGLAAAEAMSHGIPVLLSDIRGHRALVRSQEAFLYPLYDTSSAAEKLLLLSRNWADVSRTARDMIEDYADVHMINRAWKSAMDLS
ncbi:group 1 glycosyl transferase [Tianweitania populi]|uniref:Group 1 glycosyl transferase n=2 Tax=Tianweitania populi TaxID=1607949 RepID=A0A8J3DUH3_9HYPH|nr:group 1 glycosyl transferase [Tianweitania populi]